VRLTRLITSSAVVCLGLAGCAAQSAPDYLGGARTKGETTVVQAESRYGHGTISGPVRQGGHGRLEVRLPGGSWIECAKACSETLRRETVDFWENHGRDGRDGPDYLSWRR
jgi:hypothetical protein